MIRADKGNSFIISVSLWDENTGQNASERTVYYDVRDENDNPLTPTLSGILPESTVASGIYRTAISIDTAGEYICYATCDDFYSSTEEILINLENIYEITKSARSYNLSVEDVPRTNATPTASQTARNVPLNATDYLITVIKGDADSDWSTTTTSGVVFAWYGTINDELPYKMSDDGL